MGRSSTPHLRPTGTSKQLIVHDEPFLVRGAELQNSSFSSIRHMKPIWQKMRDMNVNTILGPISWEMIEPTEGAFDFSLVDELLRDARKHNLKLILLWFGTWKNGISTYVPSWVKLSPHRFPRAVVRAKDGTHSTTETISCVAGETVKADALAFAALMRHLKVMDQDYSTVIMVQVENEVGMLGDSRDHAPAANALFHSPPPKELVDFLKGSDKGLHPDLRRFLDRIAPLKLDTSWPGTFGESIYTDELFMAFHYARYVDRVTAAGKREYDLPMFTNCWLNYGSDEFAHNYPVLAGGGNNPGDYPSGGAVSNVLDIWQEFAPNLDFVSPDTYLNDYDRVCETYRHRNQPLFIPEQRRDEYGARRVWLAVGTHHAIGACPFGLDTLDAHTCAYTKHYSLMAQVSEAILQAQQRKAVIGFFFDEPGHPEASQRRDTIIELGGYRLVVERAFTTGRPGPGYGAIIHLETDDRGIGKFLLVGAGFQVKFQALARDAYFTGILDFVEKEWDENMATYTTIRRLNGDETRSGHQAIMPNQEPDDGGFPINITIPGVTRLAQCNVYHLCTSQK